MDGVAPIPLTIAGLLVCVWDFCLPNRKSNLLSVRRFGRGADDNGL
jgi:hypothetical protein